LGEKGRLVLADDGDEMVERRMADWEGDRKCGGEEKKEKKLARTIGALPRCGGSKATLGLACFFVFHHFCPRSSFTIHRPLFPIA
jgi:hypothetical protein